MMGIGLNGTKASVLRKIRRFIPGGIKNISLYLLPKNSLWRNGRKSVCTVG